MMIGGLREGELTLLTAGSGIGKSTLARELAYALHQDHQLQDRQTSTLRRT